MAATVCYFILLACLTAISIFLPKKKETKRFCLIALALSLICEIFVFGFHSFHLLFGGYEKREVPLNELSVAGGDREDPFLLTESASSLNVTLSDVGQKVGTVRIDCEWLNDVGSVDVRADASDESNAASLRYGVGTATLLRGRDAGRYLLLDLTGNVKTLRLTLTPPEGGSIRLTGITLNDPLPLSFSPLRLILAFFALLALYALTRFPSARRSFEESPAALTRTVAVMTAFLIVSALIITVLCNLNSAGAPLSSWKQTSGNQITKELVDAFEHGQVSLLDEPSEDLLAMENPYDWSARRALGVSAKWDHLLYNGKYYSYYGIAPVLLLFLPYHLLTGYYFPTAPAVFLFGAVGILFLSLLFLELVRRFGRGLPNGLLIASFVILQASSSVWYNFCYPNFYEIAQSSGFAFTCAGFTFLLRADLVTGERVRFPALVLSTTCLGLAVLCRPTLAVYCVASLFFLAFGFFKHRAGAAGRETVKRTVRYLAAALLPYVLLGGGQMLYNHVRFGSFFDFGIQYSLTINDFTRSQYHTDFVMIGLYNFLFAAPILKPTFPYIFSNFSTLGVNGYYFVANQNAVGLIFRSLSVWGYAGAVPALRSLPREARRRALLVGLPTCVIAPLVIICSIWESGYGVRYAADFAPELILGGTLLLWLLFRNRAEGQTKRILYRAFLAAAAIALLVNGAMIYDYLPKSGHLENAYRLFESLFRIP